jgi:putative hydrolase of HD superfamily
MDDRLAAQLRFLVEIDRLKSVERRNPLADGSRPENSAEHSWHLGLLVMVLAEHAAEPVDRLKVLQLVLVHDIVEVDAGDTYVYDEGSVAGQAEREAAAADRLFGLLQPDQAAEFRSLWDEFEARETPEARFAAAVDRVQAVLLNHASGGVSWRRNRITADRVRRRNARVRDGSPVLWLVVLELITDAVSRNQLLEAPLRPGAS